MINDRRASHGAKESDYIPTVDDVEKKSKKKKPSREQIMEAVLAQQRARLAQ